MSSYLQIEWKPLTLFPNAKLGNLEDAVAGVIQNASTTKPVLLFFYSNKTEKKRKKDVLTKIAKKSAQFGQAFGDPKFNVQLAMRFFNCYEIDVSNVTKVKSPFLCHDEAPLMVVYHDGNIYKKLSSGSSNRIYSILALFLKKEGFEIKQFSKAMSKPLAELYKNERKLFKQNEKLSQVKQNKVAGPKFKKLDKQYQGLEKISHNLQVKMDKIIQKYTEKNN